MLCKVNTRSATPLLTTPGSSPVSLALSQASLRLDWTLPSLGQSRAGSGKGDGMCRKGRWVRSQPARHSYLPQAFPAPDLTAHKPGDHLAHSSQSGRLPGSAGDIVLHTYFLQYFLFFLKFIEKSHHCGYLISSQVI